MKNDIYEKMEILANSAKYDVSCSSSGVETSYKKGAASVECLEKQLKLPLSDIILFWFNL